MTTPLEALAYLSRQDPTPEYFLAFHEEVNAEKNQRGAAILLASNLEVCLRYAISRNLAVVDDNYKLLFHSGAPLRCFEGKIRIGYGMGIFGDQTKNNLDCIKVIRNAFAHAVIPITFETAEIKAVCETMVMPEILYPRAISGTTGEPIGALQPNATTRQKFQKICEAISHNLFLFGTTISRGIPSDPEAGTYVNVYSPATAGAGAAGRSTAS
jgi:hypothetical protein